MRYSMFHKLTTCAIRYYLNRIYRLLTNLER